MLTSLPRRARFLLGAVAATALIALSAGGASALRADAAPVPKGSLVGTSAAGQVAWSMMPVITDVGEERSNFAYDLEPGSTVEDAVLVRNSGAAALTLAVYGSDAFTDDSGAIDVATDQTGTDAIGSWITPSVDSVSIDPGDLVRIPFTVDVPDDAQPGEHAGALLTVLESTSDTVSVDMRYATRVTATVGGDLTAGLSVDQARLDVATGFWPPPIDQQELALTAVAVAPGWWVILAGLAGATFVIVRLVRRRRLAAPPAPQ